MRDNPYWPTLHSSLMGLGVEFDSSPLPSGLGQHWLQANRGTVQTIHFHFVQPFYAYGGTEARLRWVARFAKNLALARAIGYRTVLTLHNLKPTTPLRPQWVDYCGHWVAVNLASCVMVHYDSARRLLAQRFGRRRNVSVVSHPSFIGIYPNTISRSDARRALGYEAEHTLFLFFGGIRPNKGIDSLISAFRRVPDENARLLIAGKVWPPETYSRALIHQAEGDRRVRLVAEFVPDEQLQLYLNAADAVVLPFREILTSGSAHLAMSFARAVVAPAMGSLVDAVAPDSGLLYEPSDPEGLYKALNRCRSSDLEAMGKRGYERVGRFTFDDLARETLRVYASA